MSQNSLHGKLHPQLGTAFHNQFLHAALVLCVHKRRMCQPIEDVSAIEDCTRGWRAVPQLASQRWVGVSLSPSRGKAGEPIESDWRAPTSVAVDSTRCRC